MPVLVLTEDDVRQVLTMELALDSVEEALRQLALDEGQNAARSRVQTDHVMLHVLPAALRSLSVLGYKSYTTTRGLARFHVALFDGKTGAIMAVVQADYLGQVRTGAASGVATRLMARPDASEVGVFGTGKQARTQVQAICLVRKVRRVQVYSPNDDHRRRFASEISTLCQIEVEPVPRPEMAAEDKDIIITATTSREPVLSGRWISEGTHLNVIGSNFLNKAEVDTFTLRRCKTIIVDSKEQARLEAGDLVQALDEGLIRWADIHELGQVIVGRYAGRAHPQDITLFKSLGIGIEDIAVAARVYELARAAGLGKMLEWI